MKRESYDEWADTNRLINTFIAQIERGLRKEKFTRSQLARRLGVARSYVTEVLNGSRNATLRTIVRFGLAVGLRFRLTSIPSNRKRRAP